MWKSARQLATMSAVAAALPTAILAAPLQQTEGGRGQLQSAAIERFAGQIAEDVARDDIGGITAGVFVGGETVWARGFGWADRERRLEADTETIYRVGSISKSFTAVVMAQLAARGVLDIDAPARSLLPELDSLAGGPDTIAGVTLRRLASHTAGLVREPGLPDAAAGPIAVWQAKILASIPTTSFLAAPGETYSYSNIGFGILGSAISRAAGQPFMTMVTELIFEPLAMDRTLFVMTPEHETAKERYGRDGEGTNHVEAQGDRHGLVEPAQLAQFSTPGHLQDGAGTHEQERLVEDVREGVGRGTVQGQLGADSYPADHVADLADDVVGQ